MDGQRAKLRSLPNRGNETKKGFALKSGVATNNVIELGCRPLCHTEALMGLRLQAQHPLLKTSVHEFSTITRLD